MQDIWLWKNCPCEDKAFAPTKCSKQLIADIYTKVDKKENLKTAP